MKSIEQHIQHDKELIADPTTSEPMKRHALDELHELGDWFFVVDHDRGNTDYTIRIEVIYWE